MNIRTLFAASIFGSGILLAGFVGCGQAQAPIRQSFAALRIATHADPWSLSAGSYDFVSTNQPPGGRNYFSAHSDSLGVGGDFDFQTALNAVEIKGVVDCI